MRSHRPPRELPYRLCDVFTTVPLKGNQLAVFEDAGHLSDAEMQSIAREMNLSETTFVMRRDAAVEREHGVRVRIFTVKEELPFAGHPSLGTAATIRQFFQEYETSNEIVLDLKAGKVIVRFREDRDADEGNYGEMTQPDPVFGAMHDPDSVAHALSIPIDNLAEMPIQTVSTGLPFCIVPLKSTDVLGRLRISPPLADAYLSTSDAMFFYCIAAEYSTQDTWRARMQFYNGEDPATGSAAGCAVAFLVRHGAVASEEELHLRQGVEIARESHLFARAKFDGGVVSNVRVGGSTVNVAKGLVFLK